MKRKNKKFQKKGSSNSLNKLSLFQKSDAKFSKKCPLSIKNAPVVDYKNISLLKKYVSDNGTMLQVLCMINMFFDLMITAILSCICVVGTQFAIIGCCNKEQSINNRYFNGKNPTLLSRKI